MHSPSSAVKPSVLSTLLPLLQGTQAGAAAEMRDDDAPFGNFRRDLRQDRRDVLVRQAVKAVSLHARLADFARQRNELGDCRLPAMEARVEAGDLRHAGQALEHRFDRRQVVRLMERSQRDELLEALPVLAA